MKNLEYKYLTKSFGKWLDILGYAEATVYGSINYTRDFLKWLDNQGIQSLNQIKKENIKSYQIYLQTRKNKIKTGGLSIASINNNISVLRMFSKYLQETGKTSIEIDLELQPIDKIEIKEIFTTAEIKALYKACDNTILGIRDKAILGVYYGCGLRRSEGRALNVSDILLKEKRVFVRKGKNYKERYVPITEAIKEDLENYIYTSREKILSYKNIKQEALFLSMQTKRLCGISILNRIKKLVSEAKIQKKAGLHILRHSIATHLLQSGLSLEEVSQFLGHSSLESTQIYTHLNSEKFYSEKLIVKSEK